MKQQKLTDYRPKYPRKPLRGAAMTAAALVAIGGVTGCRVPIPQNPQIEGMVAMPEPTDQELVLDGEVAIAEPTEEPVIMGKISVTEPPEEELVLDGEVAIVEPEPTPEMPLQTTGVLLAPTATPEA